jgi:di/tricarboxylate transporter
MVGKSVLDVEKLSDSEVTISAVIRGRQKFNDPGWRRKLRAGDILILHGDSALLAPLIGEAKLKLLGSDEMAAMARHDKDDVMGTIEAVVAPDSVLIGRTPQDLDLRGNYEVNLLSLSRDDRSNVRLRHTPFEAGDIMVMQGREVPLNRALTDFHLLPLAERNLPVGQRSRYLAIGILAVIMVALSLGLVPVEVGFFVGATLVLLLSLLTPREAYDAVDWPIIIILGCLIPVAQSLKDTGVTAFMAAGLTSIAGHLPHSIAIGMILMVSMLLTPLLHHAAAVLVMGPVAVVVAKNLGLGPDAFLMAVALGAACDFLTPIGHQNSLLVMQPGGYRFSDYWRLGLPLSILVVIVGTWLIVQFWT